MTDRYSNEDLMRYLDGEMSPEERTTIEQVMSKSTELRRELAIFQAMRTDFQALQFHPAEYRRSVWDSVNDTVTRPIGWLLVIVGVAVWMGYGAYLFTTSPINPWEKLATGAVVIGILVLLASVIWERYREWGNDPYRDVQR